MIPHSSLHTLYSQSFANIVIYLKIPFYLSKMEYFSNLNIAIIMFYAVLYFIGLLIQSKTMYVCWKERQGNTWQIHLTYSIAVTIYFSFLIPFSIVSNAFPNLSAHTGQWFCYLAAFILVYGFYIITCNSLLIVIMKYIWIVHDEKVLGWGKEKTYQHR